MALLARIVRIDDHVRSNPCQPEVVSHGRKNGTKVFVARDESASYDFTTENNPAQPHRIAKQPAAPAPATPASNKDLRRLSWG